MTNASSIGGWHRRAGCASLVLFMAVASLAVAEPDADRAADHVALRALAAQVTEAINRQDIELLKEHFTTPFAFTTSEQETLTDAANLEVYYRRLFLDEGAPFVSLRMQAHPSMLTRFIAEDVGYCFGTAEEEYVLKYGRRTVLTSHWTATVVREAGEWKVAAVHVGVNFLENPVLERVMGGARRVASIAGVAGLAFGVVATLLFRRKRG